MIPHWKDILDRDERGYSMSGCMCGHFEECKWCSNVDWGGLSTKRSSPGVQGWIDADFVVGTDGRYRWTCQRSWAKAHGWKILEIADLLKGKEYRE